MRILIAGLVVGMLTSCGSGKKTDEQAFLESLDSAQVEGPSVLDEEISGVLESIPQPLEIAVLLKESGQKYNASFLNSADYASNYNTAYKKALNLGIYGADLGYTNIYEQNNDGLKYMAAIKDLADGLDIGRFFDIETIGRLVTNSKNLDSLLLITTQNFNQINHYLQSQNRAHQSVLLLTGGWIEALHISTEVAALAPANKDLRETIGSQKVVLEQILKLLDFFQADPNIAALKTDFEELTQAYEKVNRIYTYKESTMEVKDGVMIVKDNSTTTIEITDEDVAKIKAATFNIRKKIIS